MERGYSDWILPDRMGVPIYVRRQQVGDSIRSVTLINSTRNTQALCWLGEVANPASNGTPNIAPSFAAPPGCGLTVPMRALDVVTFAFLPQAGFSYDGSIYLHVDPEALSASGFIATAGTTAWIWDQSKWNSGDAFGP